MTTFKTAVARHDRDPDGEKSVSAVVTVNEIVSVSPMNSEIVAHTIDSPQEGDRSDEYSISIGGWVLGRTSAVVSVEVVSSGRVITSAPVTLLRPGVATLYPDYPWPCGYSFRLGVLGLPSHFRLTVQAVLVDGSTAELGYVFGYHEPVSSHASTRLSPLMLTSLGRMGTTWLMRLLSEHPQIVVYREYPYELMTGRYWVHQLRVLSAPFDDAASPNPDSMGGDVWRVGANPFYGQILTASPLLGRWLGRTHVDRLATFCKESIDEFYCMVGEMQRQSQALFFAEKCLPDQLPVLTWELYPEAKEVFLVRDIRDAVCSMLAFNAKRGYESFGRDTVSSDIEFIHKLARDMAVLAEAKNSRANHTHLVRYEDLVAHPEPVLAALLEYVGLDHSSGVVQGMIERSSKETEELVSHRTTVDPMTSIGRWRRDLPPDLLVECAEAFGDVLAEFGYEGTPT